MLGLSSASLTRITEPLVRSGLLIEGAPQPRSPGRPSLPLEIAAGAATFVGIKLARDAVHGVLTDLKGTIMRSGSAPLPEATPDGVTATIAALSDVLRGRRRPRAIGVSLAGTVAEDGLVRGTYLLGWSEPVDLAGPIEAATGMPVVIDNDVNAFTVAEHWFGAGRGADDFAVITLGAGVGMGLVCGDELVRGHGGAAGMVGPVLLREGRPAWRAAGVPYVMEAAQALLGREVSPAELPTLALANPGLAELLDDLADATGELAGTVCSITAPERILVAGEGAVLLAGREARVAARLADMGPYGLPAPALIVEAVGDQEWARGAAALAIRSRMRAS